MALLQVTKAIAAVVNTYGSSLLIGVDNHGQPVGIEVDYPVVKVRDCEGFGLWLTATGKNPPGRIGVTDLVVHYCMFNGRRSLASMSVPSQSQY